MSRFKRLIHEIHHRSLWQVLGIYLLGAWIGYEVIEALTDGLGLPAWFPALAVVLFIIGLPVVLATAFIQEGGPALGRPDPTLLPDTGTLSSRAVRSEGAEPARLRRRLTWRNAVAGGVVAFALWGVVAAGWLLLGGERGAGRAAEEHTMDADLVAVLPFRTSGADPALTYLREGMVDLLAAKLTGEGGPRAADPRTVLSAWRRIVGDDRLDVAGDTAAEVARSVGAGRLILGGIVGTPDRLVLNATLVSAADRRRRTQASVEGPADSITALVDGLTAQLLAGGAGETERQRLAELTSTSLPALRAYLDGQAAYRHGEFHAAEEHFKRALGLDSTFALAGLGLASATYWSRSYLDAQGISVAWSHRGRLSRRDRAVVVALAGPGYPAEDLTAADWLSGFEEAVELAPESAEPWHYLGEGYYHYATMTGAEDPWPRALEAFARAAALDSTFAPPLVHLLDLAAIEGDTAEVRRLMPIYLAVDSAGDHVDAVRWRAATALRDTAALIRLRERLSELNNASLRAIVRGSELWGRGLDDGRRAAAVLAERSGTRSERWSNLITVHAFLLNTGRPAAAARLLPEIGEGYRVLAILDALHGDGDVAAASRAADELALRTTAAEAADAAERSAEYHGVCALELWRIARRELMSNDRAVARLLGAEFPDLPRGVLRDLEVCAAMIDAVAAVRGGDPSAASAVRRLDDNMRRGPFGNAPPLMNAANLTAAQLLREQGDPEAALAAVRRRMYFWTDYLSTALREEAQLAELTGDREGAIRAYRHYLALRSDPEPSLQGEVDAVRANLARLLGESGSS